MKKNDKFRQKMEEKADELLCICGHIKREHADGSEARALKGTVCLHIPDCNCIMFKSAISFKERKPRDVATETNKVETGIGAALSSHASLHFHNISPGFYRRMANRHTVGHIKYNYDPIPVPMDLNWRIGLSDPMYIMDRLNHMFEHLVDFLENGNKKDDNLGAIAWGVNFLMEAERLHPDALYACLCQCNYSGDAAQKKKTELQAMMKGVKGLKK